MKIDTTGTQVLADDVANHKWKIVALHLQVSEAATVSIKSGDDTILGPYAFAANGGIVLPVNQFGHATAAGNLSVTTDAGRVVGSITALKVR